MITSNHARMRDAEREQLAQLVSQHLSQGGRIDRLTHAERAPDRPISYNRTISSKVRIRRQHEEAERKLAEHGRALAAIGLTVVQARRQLNGKHEIALSVPKLEQIAAKYGYAYSDIGRKK